MRTQLIFVFAYLLLASSCKSPKLTIDNEMIEISAIFMTTKNYCGGAPPSQELLIKSKTPRPLSNTTFYIKKGHENTLGTPIFKEVKTDQSGSFKVTVPNGHYLILNGAQTSKEILSGKLLDIKITNQAKLNEWWKNGLYKVSGQNATLDTTFHKKCDIPLAVPYLRYTGPPRPSRK